MNKTTLLTIAVIGLLLLNAAMLVFMFTQWPPQGPPHGGKGGAADLIIEKLKLDDKQQLQFAELRKQHHSRVEALQEGDRDLHRQLFDLLKQDNADKAKADSLIMLMGENNRNIQLVTYNHFAELRKICNDEQKKLYDATIDEIIRFMMPPPGERRPPGK